MEAAQINYAETDITDVCTLVKSVRSSDVARALFEADAISNAGPNRFLEERLQVAENRISSILGILCSLQPNYELSSLPPLRPWTSAGLAESKYRSWSNVLGMRIAVPDSYDQMKKARLVANLLGSITCIK